MRGETAPAPEEQPEVSISIHSPHAGRDLSAASRYPTPSLFQSTLPMRGETIDLALMLRYVRFQSTLPMRGETEKRRSVNRLMKFQSTLPMRGETTVTVCAMAAVSFQSTLPMRGETTYCHKVLPPLQISIHSPHAGRDCRRLHPRATGIYFNPLSPCGERRRC